MKKFSLATSLLLLASWPVSGMAQADTHWAGATVQLQLSIPGVGGDTHYFGGRQETFAQSSPGPSVPSVLVGMTHPYPGCVPGPDCYNRYAAGYSEADLAQGTLKAFAASRALASDPQDTPTSWPNRSVAVADLRNTLSVTVPAGEGESYALVLHYTVQGTLSGSFLNASNRGLGSVGLLGSMWTLGTGDGIFPSVNWIESTTSSSPTPHGTTGELQLDFAGQAQAATFSVVFQLSLYAEGDVWGLAVGQAVSDFGSAAHAALSFDPRLTVTAASPFPGVSAVPEPSAMLLFSVGCVALVGRRCAAGRTRAGAA